MGEEIKHKIVVLGAGESGVGAALLAKKQGLEVFVSDAGASLKESYQTLLDEHEIPYETGQHSEDIILKAHEIIKSPGIPNHNDIVVKAQEANIPIISEIEFAARHTKARIIAITGSNGKTTTTLLLYHVLKSAGYNVGIGGNIGEGFARQLAEGANYDFWVIEISSFQLEHCFEFNPEIAIILNITPDHLDRYENNFQNYINTKFRLIQNLEKDQSFIFFRDNPAIGREVRKRVSTAEFLPISITDSLENGAFLKNEALNFHIKKDVRTLQFSQEDFKLKGKHNMINVMAAVLACMKLGMPDDQLRSYFKTFQGVEHRLEE
ncbi:MAG: UDP-N-acetylmuramoyl-L-alanine--D-glutamate ligase, partial [Bacteroidota bacterium]